MTLPSARQLIVLALLLAAGAPARADWHGGTVTQLAFHYDGSTVSFVISGWTRNNCTCNNAWPQMACLDRSRASFKEEYAWLLAARARGTPINVYLDETSCRVVAAYEIG